MNQIKKNEYFSCSVNMPHAVFETYLHEKLFIIYLKFKFCQESYNLSGNLPSWCPNSKRVRTVALGEGLIAISPLAFGNPLLTAAPNSGLLVRQLRPAWFPILEGICLLPLPLVSSQSLAHVA